MSNDDIAFDDKGDAFMVGESAGAGTDAIVDDPNAEPVMIVATSPRGLGVRCFGKPSEAIADILDQVAINYRKAVQAARSRD